MKLYKYCTINQNSLSVLRDSKIWFSRPDALNDPFEFRYKISMDISDEQKKEILSTCQGLSGGVRALLPFAGKPSMSDLNKILNDPVAFQEFQHAAVSSIKKRHGVFCLSTDKANILMWSHYGDEHKGMCIEFDMNIMRKAGLIAYEVQYEPNEYETIYFCDNEIDQFRKVALHKAPCWDYEKEYRIIRKNEDTESSNGFLVDFPPEAITGIYLGAKSSIPIRIVEKQDCPECKQKTIGGRKTARTPSKEVQAAISEIQAAMPGRNISITEAIFHDDRYEIIF